MSCMISLYAILYYISIIFVVSVMIPVLFLIFMRVLVRVDVPCRHCLLVPWPALMAVYLSCVTLRRVEQTCSGVLRICVHAAAVAMLFAYNPVIAFACSLHSLLHVLPYLASDEMTSCVLCIYAFVLLGGISQLCPHMVASDALLMALVWPRMIDVGHLVLHRLLWGIWS